MPMSCTFENNLNGTCLYYKVKCLLKKYFYHNFLKGKRKKKKKEWV